MYAAYSFGLALLCLLAAPYFLWKGHGTGRYVSNLGERLGRLPPDLNPGGRPSIWVHAVSVGEVLASRGLLAALKERLPERPLLLSTTTATGQAIARRGLAGVDGVFYVPFDLPGPVRRALDAVNPTVLVLVETEIWPNLVHEAHRRGVRVAIVNGRLSERSFAGYRRVRNLLRRVLGEIDLFLMQGEAHARRMLALGAPPERVRVSGNLKFDAAGAPSPAPELAAVLSSEGRRLWVAGSTMPGEEEMVLRAYREVQARVPDAALVVAPRHPERFAEIPAVVEAAGFRCEARTRLEPGTWRNGTVVLLDTLGELAQVYPLASVVFVGGSLVPRGGHNILEPAVAGRATVVGPHMENFREIADVFSKGGALVQVGSAAELADAVTSLLSDDARRNEIGSRARALVERSRGALATTVDAVAGLAV